MRMDKDEFKEAMREAEEEKKLETLYEDQEKKPKRGRPKKTEKVVTMPVDPVDEKPTLNENQLEALAFLIETASARIEEIITKAKKSNEEGKKLNDLASKYIDKVEIVKEMMR